MTVNKAESVLRELNVDTFDWEIREAADVLLRELAWLRYDVKKWSKHYVDEVREHAKCREEHTAKWGVAIW